ncbi:DUF418 domain-containing protein [Sphingomicrobium nitratireducens]|uniref:DUF418 domain-containing protein n=1 Tax=Sphingomicrobium nitratireducens TaxID=2964666 RepID=UPI00224066B8|nr:DUF418 domain-containing protein [Sphingomicrobium nitratireducens]
MATTSRQRILTLDIVRGIAVMGILAMNIYAFSLPMGAYFNPNAYGGDSGIDLAAWYGNFILFDGKMRGLFSILFGASTLLVIERAQASARSSVFAHYSRMLWLFVFGMIHYWFIWWGDILAMYAMAGVLLFLWRNNSAKVLRNWAIGILAVMFVFSMVQMMGLVAVLANPAMVPAEQFAEIEKSMKLMERFFGTDTSGIAAEIARMKGDYQGIMEHRFIEERFKMLTLSAQGLPVTIGIMLTGMWLFRNGFLTGAWESARYRKVMIVCLAIGLGGSALVGQYMIGADFTLEAMMLGNTFSMPLQIIAAVGWAALVILLAKRAIEGELASRIAAAGRMAFSNYLGTSIVMTSVFYGYGGNLFAEFSRASMFLFVLPMWALMLLWSKPWLERFHYGPLEWIWRSLSRLSLQPMVRREAPPLAVEG